MKQLAVAVAGLNVDERFQDEDDKLMNRHETVTVMMN
jgi:hypothetical protein